MAEAAAPVDAGLVRRSAALWRIEPLVALERDKSKRPGDWTPFDLIALQAAALDAVIAEMGLMTGARLDEVQDHVAQLAQAAIAHLPDHDEPSPAEVAEVVIANLRNVDDQGRFYQRTVTNFADTTRPHAVEFGFVRTSEADDGSYILRATDEAINLLLGALEHDLEHEQQALLLVLDKQLASGRFDQALRTAVTNRERTKQYVERVRSRIDDMRRDISSVSWFGDLDAMLDEYDCHLADQSTQNATVRGRAEDLLDQADEPHVRQQLARLLDTVTDTLDRNLQLQRWLGEVGPEFRAQQRRQVFVLRASSTHLDLQSELFQPLFASTVEDTANIVARFTIAAAGPHRDRVFDLSQLVRKLLEPTREPASDVAAPVVRDLEDAPGDPQRFSHATLERAEELLDTVGDQPVRLFELLRRAGTESDPDVAAVIWADAIMRFAPEATLHEGDTVLVAIDDGSRFDDDRFGGADLQLVRAVAHEVLAAVTDDTADAVHDEELASVSGDAHEGAA